MLLQVRRIYYQTHPVEYMTERLGIDRSSIIWSDRPEYNLHTWDGTRDPIATVLLELSKWNWVGVESGTSTGKTFIAACIVLWFLECFTDSLVVTTAPKEKQLKLGLWREINNLFPAFGLGELQELKIKMDPPSDNWIAVGFVSGLRAGEVSSTRTQGFHAKHMLIICEEMPGIPEPIMTALLNTSQAEHNLIVGIGNPDHQLDALHQFCSLGNVTQIRISAFDHPNVILGKEVIPGAVTRAGIDRLKKRYKGEDNPLYLSRARGICPSQSTDSVIRLEWCYEAVKKWEAACGEKATESLEGKLKCVGVDVANSEDGDKAAIAEGRGNILEKLEAFHCPNANALGHQIAMKIREEKLDPTQVAVDGVGVGAGTVNTLKEYDMRVWPLDGGPVEVFGEVEHFNSLRSQMWWQLRHDLEHGLIGLPRDEEMFADLVTAKWEIRLQKIKVEEKKEIKKRLSRSPDKGDAVVYWNWVRARRNVAPAVGPIAEEEHRNLKSRERSTYHAERTRRF